MSAAPFDILRYFDAFDAEDEPELHEVFVQGEEPDPGRWISINDARRRLDSTLLVALWQRGARRIAIKHEDRIVEFDLHGVILRDGSMDPVEREAST
jgi:hypothetical protein